MVRKIKAALQALPFGMGSNFVLPMLRWVRYVFVDRYPIRRLSVRSEANRIAAAIKKGSKQAVIVYDNLVSPPTYGDYLWVVLLARYFQASGLYVTFYIVDSEYRKDWEALSDLEANNFVEQQVGLAQALLNSNAVTIRRLFWDSLQVQSLMASADTIVPLFESIRNRISAYSDYIILLNYLLYGTDKRVLDDVLFSYEGIKPHVELKPVQKPYVTWHYRYSEKWALDRNVSDHDVLQIYFFLRQRFPRDAIMIMSDENGCSNVKKLAHTYGLDLLFSKDYSATFLGDGALILGSDFYFQFLGGGIGVFPWCSNMPYIMCSPLHRSLMWSGRKVSSWQTARQIFINSESLQHFLRKTTVGLVPVLTTNPQSKAPLG